MSGGLARKSAAVALLLGAAAVFALLALAGGARGASCTKTWNGGGGAWETPSDWTPSGVPASGDSVCITASGTYTVTLGQSTSVASLTVGGSSGNGTQTLEVLPALTLSTSAQDQIEASGALTLAGQNASSTTRLKLGSGALANAGLITLGGAVPSTSSAEIVGNATSTGTIAADTETTYAGGTLDLKGPLRIADGVTFEDDNSTVIDDAGGEIAATGTGKLITTLDSSVYEQGEGTTSGAEPVVMKNGALHYTGSGESTIVLETAAALEGNIAADQSVTLRGASGLTAAASFTNAGTITLDGSGGTPRLHLSSGTLTNSGTITAQASGTVHEPEILGSVTNTGTLDIDTNTEYSGGTLDNKGPLKIADGATFNDDDSTVIDDGGGEIAASGTGKLITTLDLSVYQQGDGTTSGAEPVVMKNGALHYTGSGHSAIVVATGVALSGNIAVGQSVTVLGGSGLTAAGSFTNAGAITLDGSAGIPRLHLSSGTLTNSGTITAQASGTVHEPEILGSITNTGTLNIDTTTEYGGAAATLDNMGALKIAAGATLDDEQTFINDAGGEIAASGSGKLLMTTNNGVFDQGAGTTSGTQPVLLNGIALDYTGSGHSAIAVEDGLTLQGSLATGQSLTVLGGGRANAAASFTNAGTITLDSTGGSAELHLSAGTLTNSGTLATEATGVSPPEAEVTGALANSGTLQIGDATSLGSVANSGTITLAEGRAAHLTSFAQTAGTTTLAGASHATTLTTASTQIEGGALSGEGTIDGGLVNDGRVAPTGTSAPGTLTVDGAYTQGASGELAIEVLAGGADALSVQGHATLAGTLALSTTGFTPTTHATYTPLSDSSQSGEFATVTGLASGPYEVTYNTQNVELVVLSSTPPALSIDNVALRNPDNGSATAKFTVTLSEASRAPVRVHYATAAGTAFAPGDYEAASGTLELAPGETQATIAVTVHGVTVPTADRTFSVDLSSPQGATITRAQGTATVENDHLALTRVAPNEGGQGAKTTITLTGAGFTATPTVELTRAGQPDILATDVKADPAAQALTATVDLAGAEVGAYDVDVSLPAFAVAATLPGAFTVAPAQAADISTELVGFPADSTGEPWTGELLYTNHGTVDAHNTVLAIEGFQSGAQVTVSGPHVTGTVDQDDGSSRTVQVDISDIPAGATESAAVTFTPVGDNGSFYSLQALTLVSSDEDFTPIPADPSVTASNEFTSQTSSSTQGAIHVASSSGDGDVHYTIESGEAELSEDGAIPPPSVSETTLPDGETQLELQGTLPPPATAPPPFTPTSLLSPGGFSVCTIGGGCTNFIEGSVSIGSASALAIGPQAPLRTAAEPRAAAATGGQAGVATGAARAPGSAASPNGRFGEIVSTVKVIVKTGKTVKEKYEALKHIDEEINAAKQNANEQKRLTECLRESGAIGQGQAETANNLAEGAAAMTAFEQLANQVGLESAINKATSPKALELLNSVIQSAWGEAMFGGSRSGGSGFLANNGNPNSPFNGLSTPQERLQKALELCPPPKPPPPKPRPKPPKKPHPPFRLKVRNSHDPNELVGPEGYGAGNFIASQEPLSYEAFFTNEATAGAAAREVRVSDQLDPTQVDLASFSFGPIHFGSTFVSPPPGLQSWSETVDLRPASDLLVHIEANLDTQSGLVTWDLQALDPATGLPPSDPADGFLPPNLAPPEGVGSAAFTVLPSASLPTGEQIEDAATIVFDRNAPIATAPWLNTIDASTPTSRIAAVTPATAGGACGNLAVSWGGSDTGAGIDHYDLYVSQNDSPFAIWKPMTAATSAIYPGVAGTSYRFASVATDGVLHSESAPGTPSSPVTAACAAAGGGSSPPAAAARISHLSFSPAAFAVGKGATALSAARGTHSKPRHGRVAVGSTIGYLLSAPSKVSIAIDRSLAGLKLARRGCLAATAATRKAFLAAAARTLKHGLSAAARRRQLSALLRHARCTALQTLATLTRSGHAGANQIPFSGRLASRPLAAGSYEARASVVPAASPASSASAGFEILAGAARKATHRG